MGGLHYVDHALARVSRAAIAIMLRKVTVMSEILLAEFLAAAVWRTRAISGRTCLAAVWGWAIGPGVRGLGRNHGRAGNGGQHREKVTCFHTDESKPANSVWLREKLENPAFPNSRLPTKAD